MKKIGLVGVIAGALTAGVIGFAGPAQADYGYGPSYNYGYGYGHRHDYNPWFNQLFPTVIVPHVDTTVHH